MKFRHGFYFLFLVFLCFCKGKEPEVFSRQGDYYYRLISFSEEATKIQKGKFMHVRASFQTQEDSVFWDSFNNLKDLFILRADTLQKGILIPQLSRQVPGDSFCLAIPVPAFMQEVYHTAERPYFLKDDSVVKVYLKLITVYEQDDFLPGRTELENQEFQQIEDYLGGAEAAEKARDGSGFFWIDRPEATESPVLPGTVVRISLTGSFLSGRRFDAVSIKQEFIYGNPDQVLPGINYVIGRLGHGQTAKIILPSRLAFGEFGSSNGAVPPYTPLVYEIRIGA